MSYQLGNGIWKGVFAVPNQIVDEHIKLCGAVSLKVLLLLLRHGGAVGLGDMAKALGQPVCEVQDALNYWSHLGIIAEDGAETQPVQLRYVREGEPQAVPPAPSGGKKAVEKPGSTRKRFSTQEINEMAEQDGNIAHLLQETQSVLGKPLTPVSTDMVVGLYSYYGMQPDLILMLSQYCVSIGKDNARYIEKVAATWLEKGIDTHEKAEAEILAATQKGQWERQIKQAFGIYDRNLVTSEKRYVQAWRDEMHLELDLVRLAYERTVELKGKLNFPYINAILSNWHQKGIANVQVAQKEIGRGSPKAQGEREQMDTSYDLAELEDMIVNGSLK